MDVDLIWSKDKSQENGGLKCKHKSSITSSKAKIPLKSYKCQEHNNAQCPYGDGQGGCRICGSDAGLRPLSDDSDGEPCHELLWRCFGIEVCDTSLKVCRQCASLIRNSIKFKEMVYMAFQGYGCTMASMTTITGDSCSEAPTVNQFEEDRETLVQRVSVKKRTSVYKDLSSNHVKKTIVMCTICRQRYPMMSIMSADTSDFVCSRCKIRRSSDRTVECAKCKVVIPARLMRDHLDSHTNNDLRGRCRLRSLSKKPSKVHQADSTRWSRKVRVQCRICLKQFSNVATLNEHTKQVHNVLSTICSICGKDMQSKKFLDKHLKVHASSVLFECDVCGRIFRSGMAYQRHKLIHPIH